MKLLHAFYPLLLGLLVANCDTGDTENTRDTAKDINSSTEKNVENNNVRAPQKPLDLSIPNDLLNPPTSEAMIIPDKEPLLPNLLNKEEKEAAPRIKGSLLTDKDNEDPLDSVIGAEVHFELKTN